jgi:AcrR family transcriptional regulator
MPYPAQTSREAILDAAQALIERDGADQLSLAQLAAALKIKPPSLYRHVAGKSELLLALVTRTFAQLFAAYDEALGDGGTPVEQTRRVLAAHRDFAHAHPASYVLAFTTSAAADRPPDEVLERMVLPLQALLAGVAGEEAALPALRGALALVHGFVMLELHQQLRRGGDLDAAFSAAVDAYLKGWGSSIRELR